MSVPGAQRRVVPDRSGAGAVRDALANARAAGERWSTTDLADRIAVLRAARHRLAARARALADSVRVPGRTVGDTLAAEVLPLADAIRFTEREAARVLRPRRPGRRLRPAWLVGVTVEVRRDPWGVVLIVGPSNYPLLLTAVQAIQAIAAGNAVVIKPGEGGGEAALAFAAILADAGLPPSVVTVLGESPTEARAAIEAGVDKVVLTGSGATGRAVARELADHGVPSTMELSGCDAVFVLPGADLDLVARGLRFGVTLNGGATCIAPRRLFVSREDADDVERRIVARLSPSGPIPAGADAIERAAAAVRAAVSRGARIATGGSVEGAAMEPTLLADVPHDAAILSDDLFAPVVSMIAVDSMDEALDLDRACPYALGAVVFGPAAAATAFARRIDAGVVVVNDVVVPTADPRVPFGGRGASGHGTTRGAEGLLEMTRPKAIAVRRGRARPHLEPPTGAEDALFTAWIRAAHRRSWVERLGALPALVRALRAASKRPRPGAGGARS